MERSRAYGIEIESDFPIPALASHRGTTRSPALRLRVGRREEVDRALPAAAGRCVERIEHPGGEVGLQIDYRALAGYRMEVGPYGLHFLSADGATGISAPPGVEDWRRERFLVARVLPIAALLGGREVLHASGVVLDGAGVAFLGGSGAGKSSIALRLSLDGLPVLTDDLLSISWAGGEVVAHPGTRQVGIRAPEHALLDEEELELLGQPIDRGDKHYGTVELAAGPAPIRLCYLLRRRHDVPAVSISPEEPPNPRRLLGAVFFDQLELTGMRLERQLELCAGMARQAGVYRVEVPPAVSAAELAAGIRDHAEAALARGLAE